MHLVDFLLYLAFVMAVAGLACCLPIAGQQKNEEEDGGEFGADFDAIAHERDEAAKSRARCREAEALHKDRVAAERFGPGFRTDGQEL